MSKLIIEIDRKLHARFKIHSAIVQKTMKSIVIDYIGRLTKNIKTKSEVNKNVGK